MSVENVSNNSNAGLYAAGAALVGGGAGAAVGWYSRPFLKDGAPTDSFIRKAEEKVLEELPENERNFVKLAKESISKLADAKNADEFKAILKENIVNKMLDLTTLEEVKSGKFFENKSFQSLGLKISNGERACIEKITKNINSMDELKTTVSMLIDNGLSAENFDVIKNHTKKTLQEYNNFCKKDITTTFNDYWDKSKKAFVDCTEGFGKDLKSIARGIQGKYAAIYGGITAAVLGLGTYLCCRGGGEKAEAEQPQTDVQA